METLFVTLSDAINGAPLVALGAALVWGVLSIVLSPCHLASIPLVVGYLQGESNVNPSRAAWLSLLFAAGVLGAIALIGAITAAAGRLLGDLGPWAGYGVGALLVGFGLHLLGLLPLPERIRPNPGPTRRGVVGALLFGFLFGLALGPCTFGFIAPVLGLTFRLAPSAPVFAFAVLALFGVGHCAVIGFAGASSAWVQRWLAWSGDTRGATWLRRSCGALVILAGGWMIVSAQ